MFNDMNEVFGFDSNTKENEATNLDSISGLGKSEYENSELFSTEEENNLGFNTNDVIKDSNPSSLFEINSEPKDELENTEVVENSLDITEEDTEDGETSEIASDLAHEEEPSEMASNFEAEEKIDMEGTSIEELNKLTEYDKEEIATTDINKLFDKVSSNVKEASDIFSKNTEMKRKIDDRFEELKKLQADISEQKQKDFEEVDSYKEEIVSKLNSKKEEIENRLNILREVQTNLDKEKKEFEEYKKSELQKIDEYKNKVQEAYETRKKELSHVEDILRKQKDALDSERSQLSLDKIQYESNKNELANNLLKFNELVDSFTAGVDSVGNN